MKMAPDDEKVRAEILDHARQQGVDFTRLAERSTLVLCIWCTVELTYAFEGAGPSGPYGFALKDFVTNLQHKYPQLIEEFGEPLCHTLMAQYLGYIERMPGGLESSAEMAERLDLAVDDLARSDAMNEEVH